MPNRYHNGRTPRPIPRRRKSRPGRNDAAPPIAQRTRPDAVPAPAGPDLRHDHHGRHDARVHARDALGRRGRPPRHHHDLHVLRAVRHVQRPGVPDRGEVLLSGRGGLAVEPPLQLGRRAEPGGPATRHLLSLAAGGVSNRGPGTWRFGPAGSPG